VLEELYKIYILDALVVVVVNDIDNEIKESK
jgi:hypothetical protein